MAELNSPEIGPHQGQPLLAAGQPLELAEGAMVLLHGRGGGAEGILALADEVGDSRFAYVAPQAAGSSWYPLSFLAPIQRNEPYLSSALSAVSGVIERLDKAGISPEQTILLGFSQGACLALEFAARNPQRFGGFIGLSGGLIGPEGTPRNYPGSLADTPVFLGCSDPDPHIPKGRVIESARILQDLGAEVTTRLYPGLGHTINQDELDFVRRMMEGIVAP